MISALFLAPALLAAEAAAPACPPAEPIPAIAAKIDVVAFIAGYWRDKTDEHDQEELFLPPANGVMVGLGRQVNGTRVFFEQSFIAENENGVAFNLSVAGRPHYAMPLTKAAPNEVVFSKPDSIYPDAIEIAYRREGDVLHAVVTLRRKDCSLMPLTYRWQKQTTPP